MYFFVLCEHMITRESYAYLQRDATRLATAMPCACNVWSRFVVLAACVGLVAGQACPSDVLEEYWLAGAPEQSCTDACAADGRTCVADAALPTSADCFEWMGLIEMSAPVSGSVVTTLTWPSGLL